MFETRDFLYSEEAAEVSTEDQRMEMQETLSQASDWMFEEGDEAETKVGEGWCCYDNSVFATGCDVQTARLTLCGTCYPSSHCLF